MSGTGTRRRGVASSVGRRLGVCAAMLWPLAAAAAGWEAAARALRNPYLPPPSLIAPRLYADWFSGPAAHLFLTEQALQASSTGLGRLAAGWAAAATAGIALGLVIGRSPVAAALTAWPLRFGRVLPPVALVPLFGSVTGDSSAIVVAVIVAGAVWPVLVNTAHGARIPQLYLDVAVVFRLSPTQRLVRVILPAAAPSIAAGLRLSLSLAVVCMVVGEMLTGADGLGQRLLHAQHTYELAGMWAVIVVLAALGVGLNAGLRAAERRLLAWHWQAAHAI